MKTSIKQGVNGFTLVELLVVIVLLGIVISFTVLSLNLTGLDSELKEETRKLHGLIILAKEEAIIQAQEIALVIENETYQFMYLGYEGKGNKKKPTWLAKENKVFRKRNVLKGLKLQLDIEKEFEFKNEDLDKKDFNRIFFLSSGEQSVFTIKYSIENESNNYYLLKGSINGDLVLVKKDIDF